MKFIAGRSDESNNQLKGADVIELNELVVAEGHDELNRLVAAKGKVGADEAAKEATAANIFLPFSLTKYSAVIAEVVKGYFGIESYVG